MKLFEEMEKRGHEELIFNYFEDVDLKMIISLHDTTLGKTVGGLRMNDKYKSDMDAVIESLRLSQVMTYESATADVDSGGSNALLLGDPKSDKSEAYFRAVGRFIESLKGWLVVAPDLGTDAGDFKYIQRETDYTIFREEIEDNTKPAAHITASGVYWGIKACAKRLFGSSELTGLSFAVQGLGTVGKN
ncbi:MAG: leucine dehydrogenase, partial [bacterium]|nr:leucine dehydrogenase [bacterium]